jgi:CMP-N-acetylneuraminic acid synthetase
MASVEPEQFRLQARRARSNFEALVERLSAEPATPAEELESLRGILASSHRFVHAIMALEAGSPVSLSSDVPQAFEKFANDVREVLNALISVLRNEKPTPRRWPDLREDYRLFVASADGRLARDSLPVIEADRIVNSLNTLQEQILAWRS